LVTLLDVTCCIVASSWLPFSLPYYIYIPVVSHHENYACGLLTLPVRQKTLEFLSVKWPTFPLGISPRVAC
jgi:hypothetical protein